MDPAEVGAKPVVKIGPFSGEANVRYVLREEEIEPTDEMVKAILAEAKSGRGFLSKTTIRGIATRYNGNNGLK